MMDREPFYEFFEHCVGHWSTERTYHYFAPSTPARSQTRIQGNTVISEAFLPDLQITVERSHTDFQIEPLSPTAKASVLAVNQYQTAIDPEAFPGFALSFQTVSATGARVAQALNLLFVPHSENPPYLEGDYLRDRAYEEARPIIAHFRFDTRTSELLMTTPYTQVISVDAITLVNPYLRLRRIINYHKPAPGQTPNEVQLVGFGVEQKVSEG